MFKVQCPSFKCFLPTNIIWKDFLFSRQKLLNYVVKINSFEHAQWRNWMNWTEQDNHFQISVYLPFWRILLRKQSPIIEIWDFKSLSVCLIPTKLLSSSHFNPIKASEKSDMAFIFGKSYGNKQRWRDLTVQQFGYWSMGTSLSPLLCKILLHNTVSTL